jgi:hypothetical protein
VLVITEWKLHNYIPSDRYHKTIYQDEAKQLTIENNVYMLPAVSNSDTTCIQPVYKMDTEDRLGKDRLGKDRLEIDAENPQKRKRFTPPTVEEVSAYCQERKNGVDAQRFVDYYSSNGWKVGKNAMKDWKAAVRTWERNAYGTNKAVKEETPYAGIDADCCW